MRRCEAKRPVLAVRVSYEANRLGGQFLGDAFELLAPTIVRRLPAGPAPDLRECQALVTASYENGPATSPGRVMIYLEAHVQ